MEPLLTFNKRKNAQHIGGIKADEVIEGAFRTESSSTPPTIHARAGFVAVPSVIQHKNDSRVPDDAQDNTQGGVPEDNTLGVSANNILDNNDVSTDSFAGIVSEWTREDSAAAVARVSDDFQAYAIPIASTDYKGLETIDKRLVDRIWRLNNLYMVVNEEGELVKFKLRPAQEKLLRNLHYKNIILKARQLGFTTFICLFLLDYALFNKNKNIGIVAQDQGAASAIFRKVKIAWEAFPQGIKDYLHLYTEGDSKVEYTFTNGSLMRVATSLRSGTYQALLVTEFGKICSHFPEKADEVITGTLPSVPAKGLVFIESTAEGEGGHFWEMCMDAMESEKLKKPLSEKEFKFFFFPWYQNPADVVMNAEVDIPPKLIQYLDATQIKTGVVLSPYQRAWYFLESKIQKSKMMQEHPSTPEEAFLSTGNKLFNTEALENQRLIHVMKDPLLVDGNHVYYKRYKKGHRYALGSDVSLGIGRDSSTIVVIDLDTGETVFTYKSKDIDPVNLAYEIKRIAIEYGGCIAAVEANNTGIATLVTLNGIYGNIYTQVREDMTDVRVTSKLGWLSSSGTKPKMMYDLGEAVDGGDLKILDMGILLEAKMFNKDDALTSNNDPKVTRHFDLLIATGIAWQMRIHATRGNAEPSEIARVEDNRSKNFNRKTTKYA